MAKEPKNQPGKLTRLYGITEKDGFYQCVEIKVDLDNKIVQEIKREDPIGLEAARVQFKVAVVRNVIEGSLE